MSGNVRDSTFRVMSDWYGRQVIDPNKVDLEAGEAEVTDEQSKSTVLV